MNMQPHRSSAVFSDDRKYRYALTRGWDDSLSACIFIGLNPSTADETLNDPTVRRCMGYADAWGFGGIVMLNIFALRSTDQRALRTADDPIGPENDAELLYQAGRGITAVAAWGVHGAYMNRGERVREMFSELYVLRLTKDRHPGHPLYLPGILKPVRWR